MTSSDPERQLARDTDEEVQLLVTRVRAGDPIALGDLYQRVQPRAFLLARRIVGDAALAEDAVQEAFTQLWAQSGQISPEGGRLDSLVMTIVHRRAIDLVRRRGRKETRLPDPELLHPIDERATATLDRVEETLTSEGLRSQLNQALSSLPPEQARIVRFAYAKELTLREIAEQEKLPLGTVKSRLRLAMAKLTASMRGEASR
jgi:RNA polymerase sigma-70 factor (ECF subfamily)